MGRVIIMNFPLLVCLFRISSYLCLSNRFNKYIMHFLSDYIQSIKALCEKYKVKRLFAFGSVLTNRFTDKSDIDLVVDFEEIPLEDYADNYFDLKDALSALFKRKIDLLEDKAIRNPILRKNIDQYKQLIYG